MRVLAIDCGTTSGAAFDGVDGRPVAQTWRGAAHALDPDEFGPRYTAFRQWIEDLINVARPDLIAFEAPLVLHGSRTMTNPNTARVLLGLAAIAEQVADAYGIRCCEVHVSTIKKFWTGTGRAEKSAMVARCRQLGWQVQNDNEADAMALFAFAKASVDPKWQALTTPMFGRAVA